MPTDTTSPSNDEPLSYLDATQPESFRASDYAMLHGQRWFKIHEVDRMPPFFMSGVSSSDHWMFLSSCGALTAGRQNPDSALFPYYSSDKILDSAHCTGPKTIFRINDDLQTQGLRSQRPVLWEPFARQSSPENHLRRNLYKNLMGNRFLFEEINETLGLMFRYGWTFGKRFGFIRSCELINLTNQRRWIDVVDGVENMMPSGLAQTFQLKYSNLADAYKKSEALPDATETGSITAASNGGDVASAFASPTAAAPATVAVHYLSSIPTDRAEPSEGLLATVTWQFGLPRPTVSVASDGLAAARRGENMPHQAEARGRRHAHWVSSSIELDPGASTHWTFVADTNYDHSRVVELNHTIQDYQSLHRIVEQDIEETEAELVKIISTADGRQMGDDSRRIDRHQSNVLFNVMRGGLPADGYRLSKKDLQQRIRAANRDLAERSSKLMGNLPDVIGLDDLLSRVAESGDRDLIRVVSEYLPLHFSRRHGDPTRPWNQFSIDLKNESGDAKLAYQGNWRDIFQNWEALSVSFPNYTVSMVLRFVNATTADGYNPYRVTESGFEWEVPEPDDPWSNIGYWGDHQIAYLLRLLQRAHESTPGRLAECWTREQCVYANIPYRIRSHERICENPFETIDFDDELAAEVDRRVARVGSDGRLLRDERSHRDGHSHRNGHSQDGGHWQDDGRADLVYVSLLEKLLVPALVKLGNFVPGGGVWLNTQRPEWNDANNALVGRGISVVTACYLRRYLTFLLDRLEEMPSGDVAEVPLSECVAWFLEQLGREFDAHGSDPSDSIDDIQRRTLLDAFATIGSRFREQVYGDGLTNEKRAVPLSTLVRVLSQARNMVDRTIDSNRRTDGLYHSYNLLELGPGSASVGHLYEMLEGQVAVLNSGRLTPDQSADLLDSLRESRMYREDQQSYLLYPDRKLPRFIEKNCLAPQTFESSRLLSSLLKDGNTAIIQRDIHGIGHFHGSFRNAADLNSALDRLAANANYRALVDEERAAILDLWETTFGHRLFTGRSGTFFGYEGLGSIYWHMVSKLALAVVEQCVPLTDTLRPDEPTPEPTPTGDRITLVRLVNHYREIRNGLGIHKTPAQYGAFPQDPYSHTPEERGVQQPGMTGQVKEDVLARWHELGLRFDRGRIRIDLTLFESHELRSEPGRLEYFDLQSNLVRIDVPTGSFAFTFCQTPILYHSATTASMKIHRSNGDTEQREQWQLTESESAALMGRTGEISMIEVFCAIPNQ